MPMRRRIRSRGCSTACSDDARRPRPRKLRALRLEADGATAIWIPPEPEPEPDVEAEGRRWVLESLVVEPGRDDAAVSLIERGLARVRADGVPAVAPGLVEQR